MRSIIGLIQFLSLVRRISKFMNSDKGIGKTEFISYLIAMVGIILEMLKSSKPEMYAVIIGILTGIYIICRTIYKITKTTVDDKIVESLEKIIKQNEVK